MSQQQLELPTGMAEQRMVHNFTGKQKELFELICQGKTMEEMCAAMGIGEKGVKWHMRIILQKTQCKNRKELRTKLGLMG